MLGLLFARLPLRDLQSMSCTNRLFSELITRSPVGERVWQLLCIKMWGATVWECVPVNSWRYTFKVIEMRSSLAPELTSLTLQGRREDGWPSPNLTPRQVNAIISSTLN